MYCGLISQKLRGSLAKPQGLADDPSVDSIQLARGSLDQDLTALVDWGREVAGDKIKRQRMTRMKPIRHYGALSRTIRGLGRSWRRGERKGGIDVAVSVEEVAGDERRRLAELGKGRLGVGCRASWGFWPGR